MQEIYSQEEFKALLAVNNLVVTGEIFVYKSGFIGEAYINKDDLALLGVKVINNCLRGAVNNAFLSFLNFDLNVKNVLVIGPAYGAIAYAPVVAEQLQDLYGDKITFRPARTQLDKDNKHYFHEKHANLISMSDTFIIIEDIVNEGTTIREVSALLPKQVHSAICLVDRGENTPNGLGIGEFYPFLSVDMNSTDPRVDPSLFDSGMKINTVLGKGKLWVEMFGKPPYAPGTDFSCFSLLK